MAEILESRGSKVYFCPSLDIQDKELTLREKELEHSKQAREYDHE